MHQVRTLSNKRRPGQYPQEPNVASLALAHEPVPRPRAEPLVIAQRARAVWKASCAIAQRQQRLSCPFQPPSPPYTESRNSPCRLLSSFAHTNASPPSPAPPRDVPRCEEQQRDGRNEGRSDHVGQPHHQRLVGRQGRGAGQEGSSLLLCTVRGLWSEDENLQGRGEVRCGELCA